jgi:putative FmdB family regulatory protein
MTREEPKKGRTTKQKQNFGRPDPTALKIFTGPHLPTASGVFQQSQFFCKACKKAFSKILTLAEYEKDKFKCPKCHGNKVEQRLSPFYAVTSKKS